ncbi:MAG: ABC transporter permease [Alphaproteobacteria bacterium]|nr:ABC transporter permease [Alphaproteobacteria bacterium]
MSVFLIRRLMQSVVVLFVMSVIVFTGVFAVGDPVELLIAEDATDEDVELARRQMGLDKPLWQQYGVFVGNALSGDLGKSFVFRVPAVELLAQRLPATFELTIVALLLSLGIGIPLGMFAGLYPESPVSRTIMAGSILGFSLPSFWVGLMLIMVFAVMLGWLPSTGRGHTVEVFGIQLSILTWDGFTHILLPAINLSLLKMALVIRLTRAGMREVMLTDYIKFARAKGLRNRRVVGVHAMKNILIPLVTVVGLEFGDLLAGSIVTETVFAWPGIGRLVVNSINLLDRPVIVAYMLIVVTLFIFINLVVDIIYSLVDPRVRLTQEKV